MNNLYNTTDFERAPADFYPTPPDLTRGLIDGLAKATITLPGPVLEPCCGAGALATVLAAESGLKVFGSDLYPERYTDAAELYATTSPVDARNAAALLKLIEVTGVAALVTNPPCGRDQPGPNPAGVTSWRRWHDHPTASRGAECHAAAVLRQRACARRARARPRQCSVLPCNPSPAKSESKKPLVAGGFKAATTDERQLREWFGARFPRALIGVPTGAQSGFWILDPDRPETPGGSDGEHALAELLSRHGTLPVTRTDRTPRGGRHIFFAWDGAAQFAVAPAISLPQLMSAARAAMRSWRRAGSWTGGSTGARSWRSSPPRRGLST